MIHLLDILVRPPGFGYHPSGSTRLQKALLAELEARGVGSFRVDSGHDGTHAWLGTNERDLFDALVALAADMRSDGVTVLPVEIPSGSSGSRFRLLLSDEEVS